MKNTLSQTLHEYVFDHIVQIVNKNSVHYSPETESKLLHINLLDIAGFGNSTQLKIARNT